MRRTASEMAGTLVGSKRRETCTFSNVCGNFSMPAASSANGRPRRLHDRQHLQRDDQTIAGGGAVQAQNVSGGLAAEHAAAFHKPRQHVTITYRHALEFDTQTSQRQFEPEVAHDGADHRPAQLTALLCIGRDHI